MPNIKRAVTSGLTKSGTAIPDVPDAPTIGTATNVGTSRAYNNGAATVTVTAAATGGTPSSYTATSSPGGFTGTGTSPITVTGLQSATSYTFTVSGTNSTATGPVSSASNSITATTVPQAPTIGTFTDGGTGTTGTLSFTAGATGGSSITAYKYSTDGSTYTTASGTTSPLSLTGLTAGTYTFTLKATNTNGDSAASSGVSGTVLVPGAFESIASASPAGTNTVTFSSIPSTYQHLQVRIVGNNDFNSAVPIDMLFRPNGVSASFSYAGASTRINNSGTATSGRRETTGSTDIRFPNFLPTPLATSGNVSIAVIDIHDYATTNKLKTFSIMASQADPASNAYYYMDFRGATMYLNTNAITSLTFTTLQNNFNTGTSFALYGIKGA